jgi:hypothetical protein
MKNVAIVYDGGIRDNGSPFYARMALAQVLGKDPDWYTEAPSAPGAIPAGHDFYIHPDDGRDDLPVDKIPHPWGYWIVDSHLGPDIRIEKAKQADLVWVAQKPFVDVLAKHGIKAKWLPLACEPLVHCTAEELAARENRLVTVPDKDLVFVGHLQSPEVSNRVKFLDGLFREFPNSWYAFGHFHEDMARVYHRGRLGINHAVRDDLNMRFFELASMGVLQLADSRMVGLADLGFQKGDHYIPYSGTVPAIQMAHAALSDAWEPGIRDRILADALAHVRAHHTYHHRLCTILADVEQFLRGTQCGSNELSQP